MAAHDLLPGSSWTFHEVDLPSLRRFYTSSVHFDWVMSQERHIINDIVASVQKSGRCGIALDVGMNDGFSSMLFAALGCQVHSFEIQPRCIEVANAVAVKNNFSTQIKMYESPVTADVGEIVSVPIGEHSIGSCDGGFSMHVPNAGKSAHIPFEQIGARHLMGTQLDEIFRGKDEISFMKVDTEGHELSVFEGSLALFRERQIVKVVFEASVQFWDESDRSKLSILNEIISYGYELKCSMNNMRIVSTQLLDRPAGCGVDIFIVRQEHQRHATVQRVWYREDSHSDSRSVGSITHTHSYLDFVAFLCFFLVFFTILIRYLRKTRGQR